MAAHSKSTMIVVFFTVTTLPNARSAFNTEKNFWVELTFALSLTRYLSHLGSNICKTQDQSHSDTTPLFTVHGENFQGEKPSI